MDEKTLDDWFEEAEAAYDDDREVAVVEILSRYVVHRPEHARAWFLLGDALRALGRKDDALHALLRAEATVPEKVRYYVQCRLGQLHRDWGKYEDAEQWFARATASQYAQQAGYLWIFRGSALACAGRLVEAEACHRKAATLDDVDLDEALLNLGYVLRAQRRYPEAMAAFEQAFAVDSACEENREAVRSLQDIQALLARLKASETQG